MLGNRQVNGGPRSRNYSLYLCCGWWSLQTSRVAACRGFLWGGGWRLVCPARAAGSFELPAVGTLDTVECVGWTSTLGGVYIYVHLVGQFVALFGEVSIQLQISLSIEWISRMPRQARGRTIRKSLRRKLHTRCEGHNKHVSNENTKERHYS